MGPVRIIAATTLLTTLSMVLSGCGLMAGQQPVSTAGMPGQIEPIHAATVTNDLAVFWVSSNGCTAKDDLRPVISGHGDASVITLRRISEDRCETPLGEGVEIMWSFEELGIKPGADVSINNPYLLPAT